MPGHHQPAQLAIKDNPIFHPCTNDVIFLQGGCQDDSLFFSCCSCIILILEVTIWWMFTMCQEEWPHSIFVIIWEGRPWYSKFPLETAWFREVKWLFLYLTGPPGFKYRFYWSKPKLCPLNYTFKKSTNHEIRSWQNFALLVLITSNHESS